MNSKCMPVSALWYLKVRLFVGVYITTPHSLAEGDEASSRQGSPCQCWGAGHQLPEPPERAESPRSRPCLKGVTRGLGWGHTPVGCSLGIWAGLVTQGPVGL